MYQICKIYCCFKRICYNKYNQKMGKDVESLKLWNRAVNFYHRKFDGYDFEEYLIMAAVCSIFLPFFCSLIVITCILSYLLLKGRLLSIIKEYPKSYYVIGFCILTGAVSIFYKNYLGAVCSIGILLVFLFILFYRTKVTTRLFELIVDASCIISLFCFVWALMEYYSIVKILDFDFFTFEVVDNPIYRVNSTFFNANYYAMMIEFLILMCVYKMMNVKSTRRVVFYLITITCNLLGLYLSGCRTAWLAFLVTIPMMFLLNNHKKFFIGTISIFVVGAVALIIDPQLFPRFDSLISYFGVRTDIWNVAIQGIMDHPLLGQGPLTYFHSFKHYGGHPTEHAHSVYLDPFLSFGIIGVALLVPYFYQNGKEIWRLYKRKIDIRLFSLVLAFLLTVLIHGIMDYTIFWVQTAQIFLLVLSAPSMYFNKRHMQQ